MNQTITKISLFLGIILVFISCDSVKNVPDNSYLLTKNTILVDSVKLKDPKVESLLLQEPNKKILKVPFGIYVYNLANSQPDSTFNKWVLKKPNREKRMEAIYSKKQVNKLKDNYIGFNKWIQKVGDEPVIVKDKKAKKSNTQIEKYYASFGWFNTEASYEIDKTEDKRASVTYTIKRHSPYFIGTITDSISSPVVDSLFQLSKSNSYIKTEKQYATNNFIGERDRLTLQFRNSGLYYFDQSYVEFEADTVNTEHKANIIYKIPDRNIKTEDTTYTKPFQVNHVSEIRIITDYNYKNRNLKFQDSASYNGYKLFSYGELDYFPKAITDAIAISPGKIFKDIERSLTYSQVQDLRVFKYPKISYSEDPKDSTQTDLIATILLTPRDKYGFSFNFDGFTSAIQQFGIGFNATFKIRNVFRRAEILEISGKGRVGDSKDAAVKSSSLFNNSDVGANMKLTFPRIIFPIKTEKFIPKYMSPATSASVGFNLQHNIGLDRQNVNVIYNYIWKPKKMRTNQIDLLNIQFVKNLNPENYYNVYTSSYNSLNEIAVDTGFDFQYEDEKLKIPEETNLFIRQVLTGNDDLDVSESQKEEVVSITERQVRLSENNLIFAANYTWTRDTRENSKDNTFYRLRLKVESAGALLNGLASIFNSKKDSLGNSSIGDVVFSQYAKFESEYIKHWEIDRKNVVAFRFFGGIAIPYGNSNSIPFTRSYFAGGSNDNRGWKAYDLGPGSSGGKLDFNEANLKIAFNIEERFKILGPINGAIFIDAGNIWNTLDNITNEEFTFTSFSDLKDIAVSTGVGLRYDFGFAVFRLDVGFKTYDPSYEDGERWFKDYNFGNAVYNIGINYPF